MEKYSRTELLLGKAASARLKYSYVLIAGLGAVGGAALEALARSGVGKFKLVDFDHIAESNLNRQILALQSNIGELKVDVAAKRIKDINPDVIVEKDSSFIDEDVSLRLFEDRPDFVIDAIDSLNPKVSLISVLHTVQIDFISSMGAANRTELQAVRYGDIEEIRTCPLASRLRKKLKKKNITTGVKCIYSEEQPVKNAIAGLEMPDENEYQRGRKRQAMGSISTLTMMFGLAAADYAIKTLLLN